MTCAVVLQCNIIQVNHVLLCRGECGHNMALGRSNVYYNYVIKLSHKLSSDTATWYNDIISASDKHALVCNWKAVTHSTQSSG